MINEYENELSTFAVGDTIHIAIDLPVNDLENEEWSFALYTENGRLIQSYSLSDLALVSDTTYLLTIPHSMSVNMLPRIYKIEIAVVQNGVYKYIDSVYFRISKDAKILKTL